MSTVKIQIRAIDYINTLIDLAVIGVATGPRGRRNEIVSGSQHCAVVGFVDGRGRCSPTATSTVPSYPATRAHLARLTGGNASSQGRILGPTGSSTTWARRRSPIIRGLEAYKHRGPCMWSAYCVCACRRNHHATTSYELQLSNSILQTPYQLGSSSLSCPSLPLQAR